jgi:hypothetical protein
MIQECDIPATATLSNERLTSLSSQHEVVNESLHKTRWLTLAHLVKD